MKKRTILLSFLLLFLSCQPKQQVAYKSNEAPFLWNAATVYFLLVDRFNNAETTNDINFNRNKETGVLRGFLGGDLKGVTQKIKEGYFTNLGVNAIWLSPIVEQIYDGTDEGTGVTYGYHGYWTKDWTAIDPNFGTKEDLKELIEEAHQRGIRILLDAVINHTGPVTAKDPVWGNEWVRTEPQCNYKDYESTVTCTLVKNLPDILTESNEEVELPLQLIEKWKKEGRYEKEIAELDAFFKRTGYPKAPKYYIIKWLTDYITNFGIDGYRVDTVKHVEESVWEEFKKHCHYSFEEWKKNNPEKIVDNTPFYLVGEVYGYGISTGEYYHFSDKKVNYFNHFTGLINFEFKWNATQLSYEDFFTKYSSVLTNELKEKNILNYLTSHDDGQPFDPHREKPYETANRLLLGLGASQIYYGDESLRPLKIKGAEGDANLRSFMNWDKIKTDITTKKALKYWQILGQFRQRHLAIGAGVHQKITENPYVFSREYNKDGVEDKVVIAINLPKNIKKISVGKVFKEGEEVRDAFSGKITTVKEGVIKINPNQKIVLIEKNN